MARKSAKALPPCALDVYQRVVASFPRPSDEQIADFVEYVCGAHSWYKHLPLLPPGVPFTFFLDPIAGCDRVRGPDGRWTARERTNPAEKFHYTWMLTVDYRRRFGHLTYVSGAAPIFVVGSSDGPRIHAEYSSFVAEDLTARMPAEVTEASTVELTGTIHEHTAEMLLNDVEFLRALPAGSWPDASGGDATIRSMLELCDRYERARAAWNLASEPFIAAEQAKLGLDGPAGDQRPRFSWQAVERASVFTEPYDTEFVRNQERLTTEMNDLLLPEKRRSKTAMTEAIGRMLRLVYAA